MTHLLKKGADPACVNSKGDHLLHYAARMGRIDIVGLILPYVDDINAPGKFKIQILNSDFQDFQSLFFFIFDKFQKMNFFFFLIQRFSWIRNSVSGVLVFEIQSFSNLFKVIFLNLFLSNFIF
jgi:hypothetical protein